MRQEWIIEVVNEESKYRGEREREWGVEGRHSNEDDEDEHAHRQYSSTS